MLNLLGRGDVFHLRCDFFICVCDFVLSYEVFLQVLGFSSLHTNENFKFQFDLDVERRFKHESPAREAKRALSTPLDVK